jgi:Ca2+-binding RTX toxin-like protein
MHGRGSWIAVVPANGGTERRLTPTAEWALADAAPDGKRVLLVSGTDGSSPALWNANVDGSGRRLLVRGANGGAWSHDGAWIAYTAGEYTKDHAIHLVHPDGTGRRVLVGRGRDPAWSPDGRTIAYSDRGPCLNTGVYTISLASGQARRLTQDCHLVGTARADVLLGTSTRDLIRGGAGDDVIRANPGDRPNAYFGQFDDDVVDGGPGNDTIFGGRDPDVLRGRPGDDRIFGGRRRDRLVGGPGRDLLEGGRGNDFIDARDGVADVVRCGPGVDRVLADSIDLVERGCEHIARR